MQVAILFTSDAFLFTLPWSNQDVPEGVEISCRLIQFPRVVLLKPTPDHRVDDELGRHLARTAQSYPT